MTTVIVDPRIREDDSNVFFFLSLRYDILFVIAPKSMQKSLAKTARTLFSPSASGF